MRKDKYVRGSQTFVNPYNFVSLQEGCSRGNNYTDIKRQNTVTGWIECEIKTLTPIFIPNSSSDDAFNVRAQDDTCIKSYDFFSYDDISGRNRTEAYSIPIIPGSEIRGMIRSAFEAVTNSCLSTIEQGRVLFKRFQNPARPGRLFFQNGEWKIQVCSRFRLPKNWIKIENNKIYINGIQYNEGQRVYVRINYRNFKVQTISTNRSQNAKEGFLHIGEYNENKNYESVFIPKKDRNTKKEIIITLPNKNIIEILINLVSNILLYREKINKTEKHNRYRHFDQTFGELKDISDLRHLSITEFNTRLQKAFRPVVNYLNGALIYYTEHNGRYYLSPAAIGREVFYNKLSDIIGDYAPCTDSNNLCAACALFGMVGNDAVASRVRFTDAFVTERKNPADYYDEIVTLPELASPKPSATEFYLKRPDAADLWNYDYAGSWSRRNGRVTSRFEELPAYSPEIRGRKFYWHHKIDQSPSIKKEDATERNVVIRPVKKGITFSFKVYFNQLTEQELKRLIWVLEIGGNKDHAHKIGMGKPIGLGSVQIIVKKAKIRRIQLKEDSIDYRFEDFNQRLNVNEENCKSALGCSKRVFKEFMKITDFKNAPDGISYPENESEEEGYFHWFVANKQAGAGTGTSPVIEQTLPGPERPQLKKYKRIAG